MLASVSPLNRAAPVPVQALLSELDTAVLSPDRRSRTRLPTGFEPLDRALGGGVAVHDLVVVGGRPGVGKTVATLQWARNLARRGIPVVYACYEHDASTLIARLLALEIGMLEIEDVPRRGELERAAVLAEVMAGGWTVASAIGRHPLVRAARAAIDEYGSYLTIFPASSVVDTGALADAVDAHAPGGGALVVDYLQKVPTGGSGTPSERLAEATSALKELALSRSIAVVGIAAAAAEGLQTRRIRLHHLDSAAVLGYEADVVVLLNEKRLAVSKVHLSYDTGQAERFSRTVVFSIEKNRGGPGSADVEFEKDFAHFRFKPVGGYVAERLIDEVVFAE